MFGKNPDPKATNLLSDSIIGLKLIFNGKGSTRYEIMIAGGASEESIDKMRIFVAGILAYGFLSGIVIGALITLLILTF